MEATEQRACGQREAPADAGIFAFLQLAGVAAEAEKACLDRAGKSLEEGDQMASL
jgi:hypothetical protein